MQRALCFSFLSALIAACLPAPEPPSSVLSAQHPEFAWSNTASETTDFDGDGTQDFLTLGTSDVGAAIAVVAGSPPRAYVLAFGTTGSEQLGTCGVPTGFVVHAKQPPDPRAYVDLPAGYSACPECPALTVGAGECDPLHVFWNHETNSLGWWRM